MRNLEHKSSSWSADVDNILILKSHKWIFPPVNSLHILEMTQNENLYTSYLTKQLFDKTAEHNTSLRKLRGRIR